MSERWEQIRAELIAAHPSGGPTWADILLQRACERIAEMEAERDDLQRQIDHAIRETHKQLAIVDAKARQDGARKALERAADVVMESSSAHPGFTIKAVADKLRRMAQKMN